MNFKYFLERTAQALITVIAVITITFALIRFIPGGPMDYMVAQMMQDAVQGGGQMDEELVRERAKRIMEFDPEAPMYVQYYDYVTSILTGDLGQSMYNQQPVAEILADALPWTLLVMSTSSVIAFVSGIVLGGLMAYYEGSRFDSVMTFLETFSSTVPYYVFALILLDTLAFQWVLFPSGGRVDPGAPPGFNVEFIGSVLYHAALPILSMVLATFGGPALEMRANSIKVLGSDYMRVARLRGLPEHVLGTRYVAKNGVLPLYTGFMISIAVMFGGAVILEEIFSYTGMGYYIVRGFHWRDYPLLMGAFILLTIVTVIGIYIADLTYSKLDPRVETGDRQEAF